MAGWPRRVVVGRFVRQREDVAGGVGEAGEDIAAVTDVVEHGRDQRRAGDVEQLSADVLRLEDPMSQMAADERAGIGNDESTAAQAIRPIEQRALYSGVCDWNALPHGVEREVEDRIDASRGRIAEQLSAEAVVVDAEALGELGGEEGGGKAEPGRPDRRRELDIELREGLVDRLFQRELLRRAAAHLVGVVEIDIERAPGSAHERAH